MMKMKDSLLNNPNNSFGMIFVKSKLLSNEKYSIIQEMWDDFIKITMNSISITKFTYINADLNTATFITIIKTFCDVLNRDKDIKYDFDLNKEDIRPEFNTKFNFLPKSLFENIKNDINYEFTEAHSSIYRKINQRYIGDASRIKKINIQDYRNNTGKIVRSSVDPQIKDESDQLIHHVKYANNCNYRQLLDTIFQPNKASLPVLSNTGTEIEITALLFH